MIRTLTGIVTDIGDNYVILDVNSVGYLVGTPTLKNTFHKNDIITLYTYLSVRETSLDLYGFQEKEDLTMFELLLGIPKIGPKSALQILSSATSHLLGESAHKNDPVYLHKLSGIGKKTCENIVQYLNKKLDRIPSYDGPASSELNAVQTDAIDALVALGYDNTTAREKIQSLSKNDSTVNSLVTEALKQLD